MVTAAEAPITRKMVDAMILLDEHGPLPVSNRTAEPDDDVRGAVASAVAVRLVAQGLAVEIDDPRRVRLTDAGLRFVDAYLLKRGATT